MKNRTEINVVPALIRDTCSCLRDKLNPHVRSKGNFDIVTDYDLLMEEQIRDRILRLYPGDRFLAEEGSSDVKPDGRTWVLDPIDGTLNFAMGLPLFGTHIALLEDLTPVFSTVYLPAFDELYYAQKGRGAFCGGKTIHVREGLPEAHPLLTFGDFSRSFPELRRRQLEVMGSLYGHTKVKMLGSSSVDYAYLARGRTQAHITFGRNIWDNVPGLFLAQEAGACTNFQLESPPEYIVCAASRQLLDQIIHLSSRSNI